MYDPSRSHQVEQLSAANYDRRMTQEIDVSFLPEPFGGKSLTGTFAVVIDVLRASTTIVTALAHGAKCVIPFSTPQEALAHCENLKTTKNVLLGGERHGILVDGFDLGNSPLSYDSQTVRDCTVLFTTTNGTNALLKSTDADEIVVGSFVNLSAVTRHLAVRRKKVRFVCAGTDGEVSFEDVLCAGAMIEKMARTSTDEFHLSDAAVIARSLHRQHRQTQRLLFEALKEGRGGRNLLELGFEEDIEFASKVDLFEMVPRYNPREGRIEPISANG